MSFDKSEEKVESFRTFGDLLRELNEEYGYFYPSKKRLKRILQSMLGVVK